MGLPWGQVCQLVREAPRMALRDQVVKEVQLIQVDDPFRATVRVRDRRAVLDQVALAEEQDLEDMLDRARDPAGDPSPLDRLGLVPCWVVDDGRTARSLVGLPCLPPASL